MREKTQLKLLTLLKFNEMDIMDYLGEIPEQKIHCAILTVRTLEKTIEQYLKNK